jgi:hypothetical protein
MHKARTEFSRTADFLRPKGIVIEVGMADHEDTHALELILVITFSDARDHPLMLRHRPGVAPATVDLRV